MPSEPPPPHGPYNIQLGCFHGSRAQCHPTYIQMVALRGGNASLPVQCAVLSITRESGVFRASVMDWAVLSEQPLSLAIW